MNLFTLVQSDKTNGTGEESASLQSRKKTRGIQALNCGKIQQGHSYLGLKTQHQRNARGIAAMRSHSELGVPSGNLQYSMLV